MQLLFGLGVILSIACAVHAARHGRTRPWLWIILLFPVVGSLVYILSFGRFSSIRSSKPLPRPGLKRVAPGPFAPAGRRPDEPIPVESVSQIEPRACREDCSECGGPLKVCEQRAEVIAGRSLRVVCLECARCGALPVRYFQLTASEQPGSAA